MRPEAEGDRRSLRVLAADEDEAALQETAAMLEQLGHQVTSLAVDVSVVAEHVAADDPQAAIVVVHRDDQHALDLIAEINAYASGPVVALLGEEDPDFVRRAAECGVDGFAGRHSPGALQSAIELALQHHAEAAQLSRQVDQLETALDRRAVIERAKGILMERHGLDERQAFELVRGHARARSRTVVDTAQSVLDGHALLSGPSTAPPSERGGGGA